MARAWGSSSTVVRRHGFGGDRERLTLQTPSVPPSASRDVLPAGQASGGYGFSCSRSHSTPVRQAIPQVDSDA